MLEWIQAKPAWNADREAKKSKPIQTPFSIGCELFKLIAFSSNCKCQKATMKLNCEWINEQCNWNSPKAKKDKWNWSQNDWRLSETEKANEWQANANEQLINPPFLSIPAWVHSAPKREWTCRNAAMDQFVE